MRVSVSGLRSYAPAAIAALWLAAHLPFLSPSLEDIDSINFALALREFDPALDQPHPPGYPVYVALTRVSMGVITRVQPSLPRVQQETLALAVWSALAGVLALLAVARLFAEVARRRAAPAGVVRARAAWGTALLAVSPLFWMSGLRPMSDMPGLAAVLWAVTLMLEPSRSGTRLFAGALVAGLAGGIRIQTLALTMPVLLLALVERCTAADQRARLSFAIRVPAVFTIGVFMIGIAAWAIPLVVLTGGVDAYLRSLGRQAGEDFAWVDMLWMNPTPRRAVFSIYETFILPWAATPLAAVVGIAAAAGLMASAATARRALFVMAAAFVPYLVYHLLFQESLTVRYSLPLLPLVAWLAIEGLSLARRWMPLVAVPVLGGALIVSVVGGRLYAHDQHPAFRAVDDAGRRAATDPPAASFAHYALRRTLEAAATPAFRTVPPPRTYEWMGLVDYWRGGGDQTVWFFADPKRTDLALVDPHSRRDVVRYRWLAEPRWELSGTRPLGVDWYRLPPPAWFAAEGWSLTPETGGVVSATAAGPDHRPIQAWVRRRQEPMHLLVGGRHLGEAGAPDAEFELVLNGALVDRWRLSVAERNFLRFVELPQGLPVAGERYAPLLVASRSTDGRPAVVAVRQFDVQPAARLIWGFGEGWHEEEYAPATGLRWLWSSGRSVLRLRGPAQAVRLTLRGESPLRYIDAPPVVTVSAGGQAVGEFRPAGDFDWSVVIPAEAWSASGGAIVLETAPVYLPGPAEGTSDSRELSLRLFETRLDPLPP